MNMASLRISMRSFYRYQQITYRHQNSLELSTNVLLSNNKYKKCLYTNNVRLVSTRRKTNNEWKNTNVFKSSAVILALVTMGFSVIYLDKKRRGYHVYTKEAQNTTGDFNPKLISYTLEEVAKHNSIKERVWVTFGRGVYDITDFIEQHPGGGEKIMMAAGGSVEPFWMMYGVHKTSKILAILEQYRIGNISMEDAKIATSNMEDPYSNDPKRHPALQACSVRPYNAEPPTAILVDSFITPTALFYVRNHLPVPEVDEESYTLEISGVGVKSATLTLNDIKNFPKHSVTACIQCAGNRRSEMSKAKQVKGLEWGTAAIGNATWSGARLYDVLTSLGLKEDDPRIKHIQFEGLDTDVTNVPYGASIPVEKGMDPRGDVLLAYEMNGEPLTRDHGFPIRVIVPGIVGARNVKWLGSIVVSEEESSSHWQQNDYKGFSPSVDWNNVDWPTSPAIQELPVTSVIGEPTSGSAVRLDQGRVKLKGYAFSGGGHQVVRVDVTADQGRSWHTAQLLQEPARPPRHWGWTLWTADIPVDPKSSQVEFWVKAVDNSYNTQPESFNNIWNLRGVLSNAYHRITVNIKK